MPIPRRIHRRAGRGRHASGHHTAVLLNPVGAVLADITVHTTPAGLAELLAFAAAHAPGERLAWVVEGTRSHGAGLLRVLRAAGQLVIEAPRASRKSRRGGKSDPLDAIAAGRAALGNHRHAQPRIDGIREDLRIVLATRTHLTTARTATVNLIEALLVTGDTQLRESTRGVNTTAQIRYLAQLPWLRSAATGEHTILFRELRAHAKPYSTSTHASPTTTAASSCSYKPSCPSCSTNPASGRSTLRSCSCRGRTPAVSLPRPPSPAAPA